MSTASDIFTELDELIDSITELVDSNTVESVVALIDMLGGGTVLHELLLDFKGLLATIRTHLQAILNALEEPLRHAQALAGLMGLLQPLVTGLQRLVNTSAEQLEQAGLETIMQISEPIGNAVGYGSHVLGVGSGILETLPTPEQVQEIQSSFDELIDVVQEYVEATAS